MNRLNYIAIILVIGVLFSQDPPALFQFNQSTLQGFYYFNTVSINGVDIESDDWVGAFNGNICVGSRLWDTSQCGQGEVCDLPAMGNDGGIGTEGYMLPGQFPSFKIYDASENLYYTAAPSEIIGWSVSDFPNINTLTANTSIFGCMDDAACNYDPSATDSDGSCEYNYDCDGNCGGSAELDACGVCNGYNNTCLGCVDSYAIN